MSTKLHQRSTAQADRVFWITVGVGVVCALFVMFVTENRTIAGVIMALVFYHLIRRLLKGPPVGVAVLEVADSFLILRNPSTTPAKVDRIALEKLHSVELQGEEHLRYFNCKLMNGDIARIGPFERGQGEMAIAEWFYANLPETPFHVDPSATPVHQLSSRPPGM
ncbi:hypothetical protein Q9Q94_05330 [Uliginosibacterium sp. 31-16]|uniref:hypothetical protein n=1 Tax=Uliginosibacterium sp. 31-16 TaxID=3068315 RepID=UPI00273DF22F|nr:hypothetical protein [Uliginosibacterium sp. 31-16]MDP5238940.1 hypothetical protein [Uliginosibacterium sp. 31-16]